MACFPDIWAPTGLSYFTAVASAVFLLLITAGNVAIILAVTLDPLKKLRSPFNYFLVNLAVSDLLVGILTMPVSVGVHLQEANGWIDPSRVKIIHLSYFISATASVFSIAALSVDRFLAIKWPIRYRSRLSIRRCCFISLGIWILSITVPMLYLKVGYISYLMVFVHLAVFVTFSILLATYIQVYKAFRQQVAQLTKFRTSSMSLRFNQLNAMRSEKKVTRTFLWILTFFISAYAPAVVMIYILHFCRSCNCQARHSLRDLQFLLVSANSCVNPIICAIRLKTFRTSILSVLKLNSSRKSSSAYITNRSGNSSSEQTQQKSTEDPL